jgi:hypothetical protein
MYSKPVSEAAVLQMYLDCNRGALASQADSRAHCAAESGSALREKQDQALDNA